MFLLPAARSNAVDEALQDNTPHFEFDSLSRVGPEPEWIRALMYNPTPMQLEEVTPA